MKYQQPESTKKKSDKSVDEMRPEYDLTRLKFVGRGLYAKQNQSRTNIVTRVSKGSER
jgi:hypothetical protein